MKMGSTRYLNESGLDIDIHKFRAILDDTLDAIVDEIVTNNAALKVPEIGVLGITVRRNSFSRPKINKALSFNLRKQIIARGGTPRKLVKEDGKIIEDNKGEDWMIYYTNDAVCQIKFNTHNTIDVNGKRIKYKPNREFPKKVAKFIQTNPLKETAYETYN